MSLVTPSALYLERVDVHGHLVGSQPSGASLGGNSFFALTPMNASAGADGVVGWPGLHGDMLANAVPGIPCSQVGGLVRVGL